MDSPGGAVVCWCRPLGPRSRGGLGRPSREENALDHRIRQLLRDLGRALSEALDDSSDMDEVLRRVRAQGYNLIIVVDRGAREGGGPEDLRARLLPPADPTSAQLAPGRRTPLQAGSPSAAAEPRAGAPPAFRIDAADLAFLRSIGIDPTRKVRGRKP